MLKFIPILLLTVAVTTKAYVIPGPELLHAAAYGNNTGILESLIKNGADCKARDSFGRTLILAAASSGNEAIFDVAIKSTQSVNDTDFFGANALSWAIYSGNLKIIKKVRSLGGEYKKNSIIWRDTIGGAYYGSPLNCAAGRSAVSVSVMKYLIDSCKAAVNEREFTPDNEATGWIPLHWAVESDNIDKVQYLLSAGASVNDFAPYDCRTPIGLVTFNSKIVDLLFEKGAVLDSTENYSCSPPFFTLVNRSADSLISLVLDNYKKIRKPKFVFSTLLKLCLTDTLTSDFDTVFNFVKQHSIPIDTSEIVRHLIIRKNYTVLDFLIKNKVITPGNFSIPLNLFQNNDDVYFDDAAVSMNLFLSADEHIKRADSCFAILINNKFDFADNSSKNDCFLEALKNGCIKSVHAMLRNGVSLDCFPENDLLIVYSLVSNDTGILDALVRAGHKIKNRHFLDRELTGCTSATLQHAFQLAQSVPSEDLEDTKDLITCVLLAASRNGCVDLVKSLHKSGARLDLYESKKEQDDSDNSDDSQEYESENRTIDPEYQNAVAFNLLGSINPELLNYYKSVNKNAFDLNLNNAFKTISNTFLPKCDSVKFDYLISNCHRSNKPVVIENALDLLAYDSTHSLGLFVFKKYHTMFSDEQLVDLFADRLVRKDNELIELFNNDGAFEKKHDKPSILAASHILNGDTIQAEKYVIKSKAIKRYKLLYKCVSNGNYTGLKYLLNKNSTISKRESDKTWSEFLTNLSNNTIPEKDSSQVLGLIDRILENYYVPNKDNTYENNLSLLNRFIKKGNDNPYNIHRAIAIKFIEHGVSIDVAKNRGVSPLIVAIQSGDSILVKYLLSKGMNPDQTNQIKEEDQNYYDISNTVYPFQVAINNGYSGICRELIRSGANIFVKDEDGNSIIEYAIAHNMDTLALEILTAVKPDKLGMFDFKNRPVISKAISASCSVDLIEKLIQSGADVNFSSDGYPTPIFTLIGQSDNHEKSDMLLDLLIRHDADLNIEDAMGSTLVHASVTENNFSFVEKFINKGIDINKPDNDGNTPLITALTNQYDSISLYLIKKGADVNDRNDDGLTPLHYAAKNCNQSIVQALCANGADINMRNDDGMNPVEYLINSISDSMTVAIDSTFKLLLSKGAMINKSMNDGSTILHAFAKVKGTEDYIKVCIKAGIDINAQNNDGYSALMDAIRYKNEKFACELIKAGANIHLKSEDGNNLLHHVANSGIEAPCLNAVLPKIKNVDAVNDEGKTPLHIASTKSPGLFSNLLSNGASLAKKDYEGNTPLLLSAINNMPNNVYSAIKNSADVNVKNKREQTPLLCAIEANSYTSVVLLLNAHAKFIDGKIELKAAIENADWDIIFRLLKEGIKIDSIDSFVNELNDNYYSSDKNDSVIALIKKPLLDLPQLPDIESNIKPGFWWLTETVPLSMYKRGTCTLTDKQVNSIDEAEELIYLDRYQIESHSRDNYRIDRKIKMIGNSIEISSVQWNMTQKNNFLYMTNEENNECKVFKYSGNEMPESWKQIVNSYEDYY